MEDMRTVAIIPARAGSRRVPGKNLVLLPYTLRFVRDNSDLWGDVVVTSDISPYLLGKMKPWGKRWRLRQRPARLARGEDGSMDRTVEDALEYLGIERGMGVLLQPTSPFRSREAVEHCIDLTNTFGGSCCTVDAMGQENGNVYTWLIHQGGIRVEPRRTIVQGAKHSFQVDAQADMDLFRHTLHSVSERSG